MTPEVQSLITNAELTLIPLAVTALALWLRSKIAELKALNDQNKTKIDENASRIDVHDNLAGVKTSEPVESAVPSPTIVVVNGEPIETTLQGRIKKL